MLLIKRYPNRKLYNTRGKCYVTLEQLAQHIHLGEEIQVHDYLSGDDLTTLTLSQIIFEQEKRKMGFLSRSILANLIRFTADVNPLRSFILSPDGDAHSIDDEIKHRLAFLMSHQLINADEASKFENLLIDEYQSYSHPKEDEVLVRVKEALSKRNIPTQEQVTSIKQKINDITNQIDDHIKENI